MFLLTVITFHKLETETVADFLIQRFYFDIVLSLDVLTDDGVLLASGAPVTTDNQVHVHGAHGGQRAAAEALTATLHYGPALAFVT